MKEESTVARHYTARFNGLARVEYIGEKPKEACIKQINVGSQVFSVSFSPDGTRVVSRSWEGVRVWDVVSGESVFNLFRGRSNSVAYSNDGKYIGSGNDDGTISIWNAGTGESIHGALEGHTRRVNCVAFSPDSKYIASGSDDRTVRIWDVERGSVIGEPLQGHSLGVRSVIFISNGIHFASSSLHEIIVWDVESREMTYPPLEGSLGLVFSHDSSKIMSQCSGGVIRIWEVSTGTMLREFYRSEFVCRDLLASSPDSRHILVEWGCEIMGIFDVEDSKTLPKLFRGHTNTVTSASYSPDGTRFVSGSKDGTIRLWDAGGGQTDSNPYPGSPTTFIGVSVDGKCLVTGSWVGMVTVWSAETGEILKGPFRRHETGDPLAFTSDGDEYRFASGSRKNVLIWKLNGETITCHGRSSASVCFSPDGRYVASGSKDKTIRVWNSQSGLLTLGPLEGHESTVNSVCYSGDGTRIVSGSNDRTVRIWDSSNGNLLSTLKSYSPEDNTIACSHNGSLIIFEDHRGTIRVWDAKRNNLVHGLTGGTQRVFQLCFSSDDAWIASRGPGGSISIWNAFTGSLFFKIFFPALSNCIVFLPSTDPKYFRLASASNDGLIRIWCLDLSSQETTWNLQNNGWLTGNDGNLLFWVPSDLRSTLTNGPCTRILNSQFSTKLILSENQGTRWTACHRSLQSPSPILHYPIPRPRQSNCMLPFYTRLIPSPFIRLLFSFE